VTTWQDASFLLLQAKQIQTNKLAAQPAKQITSQNAGNSNELTVGPPRIEMQMQAFAIHGT